LDVGRWYQGTASAAPVVQGKKIYGTTESCALTQGNKIPQQNPSGLNLRPDFFA